MPTATLEAFRAFALFGGGALLGFCVSILTTHVNARTRLVEAVLTEAERETKRHRRRAWNTDKVLPVVIVIVMVALLLSGVSWIRAGQQAAEDRRRDCLRSAETARVLQQRTNTYLEAARSEKQLWTDLRRQLRGMGAGPRSPLVQSIDRHLEERRDYLKHLRTNPYPREPEC